VCVIDRVSCRVREAEDERDLLYFMRNKPSQWSKSKWSHEQLPLTQIKLDTVEVEFKEPIDKYETPTNESQDASFRTFKSYF